jgi:hypothetical protein
MAKKIVFCADGTWNGPEDETGVAPMEGRDEHGVPLQADVVARRRQAHGHGDAPVELHRRFLRA